MQAKPELTPGSGRDLRFDSIRGLMLVTMTLNHLPASMLRRFSDQYFGIFSSAEGFVFLSGILAGFVYTRRRRKDGPEGLMRAVQHRAGMIYRWHVGSFLLALLAAQATCWLGGFCSWSNPPLFFGKPWLAALLGSLLLYQPGLLDILPMYCGFVLLLPAVLAALEEGRLRTVLGLSFLAWFAVQWIPPVDGAPLYPIHVGSFNIFAWQFLFVAGVAVGHVRLSRTPAGFSFNRFLLGAAAVVAVLGLGVEHWGWRPPVSDPLYGVFLNKPNLGLLRLTNFLAVAYLVGALAGRFPALATWRPLAFLGQHSIAVVSAQSVGLLVLLQFSVLFSTPLANVLTTLAILGLLFAVAACHQAYGRWMGASKGLRRPLPVRGPGTAAPAS